jgi:lipopolysaccharide export LptBFGC system permease protein LptF
MFGKILSSTWFAVLVLIVAAVGLFLLYSKGRTSEAMVGGGLLALAAILIILGRDKKEKDRDY